MEPNTDLFGTASPAPSTKAATRWLLTNNQRVGTLVEGVRLAAGNISVLVGSIICALEFQYLAVGWHRQGNACRPLSA